jgi:hypothetical protein
MEPLRMAALSCSLSDPELREQLARYRVVGDSAEVLEWSAQRRLIRVTRSVPEPIVERLVEVERECCPFFQLSWDGPSRSLLISVSATDQAPALDAVSYALGLAQPAPESAQSPGSTARN